MKPKYLNIKNCLHLLPRGNGLPVLSRLEHCLHAINSSPGLLNGSIDALIEKNQRTNNQIAGDKRLCHSPVEIAQRAYIETGDINTQAVERRFLGPALLHTILGYKNGMVQKTMVPLQFLLKGWGDASSGHQGYVHTIAHDITNLQNFEELVRRTLTDSGTYYYVGITKRNWLERLDEHIREMQQGNRRHFYQVWRENYGIANVLFSSYLSNINLTYQEAMDWEEKNVDKISSDKYGLNMIPGGYKGLRLLHKCRIINNTDISLVERDKAIAEYALRNPRKGLPNPFIAELWKNNEYYLKIIEARQKTLTPEQVKKIRELNKIGRSVTEITEEVNALNITQVRNVIAGRTYGRIS